MADSAPAYDSRRYECPQCGAPVSFRSSIAIFAVCGHCRSSVVRKDFQVETFGTMAELPPDLSPLQIGTRGHFQGRGFTLIGRLRIHWKDGSWNEWCADFGNGQIGWVAEAMGFFMVSFETKARDLDHLPGAPDAGQRITLAGSSWLATDVKNARCIAAEGELPFAVAPNAVRKGIDLTGPQGAFGSLEITEAGTTFYSGHYAQFDDLNFSELRKVPGWDQDAETTRQQSQGTNCPNCAAPVHIRAEGQSMSAVCGSCGQVIDTSKPEWTLVDRVVQTTLRIRPVLPIGARGIFKGDPWEVIGFMRRKDRWCQWDEFLLFNPWLGFRYLVTFRGHWSFVRILPGHSTGSTWNDESFVLFAREDVTTTDVLGEFYWRVHAGERVRLVDHVAPPRILSSETSKELNEIAWSGGEYVDYREVQAAFLTEKGQMLPPPNGIYLNQPNPHLERWKSARTPFLFALAAFVMIQLFCLGLGDLRKIFELPTAYQRDAATKTIVTDAFDVSGGSGALHITANTAMLPSGGYLAMQGTLVNQATQQTYPVSLPMTNHLGQYDELSSTAVLSSVPSGKYYLRFDPDAAATVTQAPVRLTVSRGGLFWSNFILGLIAVCAWPLWLRMRVHVFERERWLDSEFNPYATASDDE